MQRKRVHRIMLRLLRCLPADYHETSVPLCYSALAGLCDAAPDIQAEVVTHMDVLVSHLDAVPTAVSMLLSAVFSDNVLFHPAPPPPPPPRGGASLRLRVTRVI